MKKLLLSALSLTAMMGFAQLANADVTNGALQQNSALCGYGYNPNCYPSNNQRQQQPTYTPTPFPTPTPTQCEARPNGGKLCLYYKSVAPSYKDFMFEYNAQGEIIYNRQYHNDGQTIKTEQWYNNQGIRHGAFKSYHENGKLKSVGNFVNGKLQGEFPSYNEQGQMTEIEYYKDDYFILEVPYANGKKHGTETEYGYFDNGKKGQVQYIARTAQWVNGVKHGNEQFFEPSGKKGKNKLVKTVVWQNGKPLSQ